MRQFYLENEYGEQVSFQSGELFFWQPSGLGYADDNTYSAAGNYYVKTEAKHSQEPISGTLIFLPGKQYEGYYDFVNWIYAARHLKLAYKPDVQWYFVDVDLVSLEKSEINEMNLLEIPAKFMPKTPWYSEQQMNIDIGGEMPESVKKYAYAYPYRYCNNTKAGAVTFTLPAQLPSGFYLTIEGAAANPIITATIENTGERIGKIDLSAMSAQEGERLIFSTLPDTAGAYLVTPDGKRDLTSFLALDSSVPAFFDIPPGAPVEFAINADAPKGLTARLTVNRYYRTV